MSDEQDQGHRPAVMQQPTSNKMPRTITSRDLLGTDKMVIIRHDQKDYRLQVTAAGKLILTK